MKKIPRILLAAVSSNSGKTAAACGMMSAYVQQYKEL
jgi:cobyrinic acid a,c-diamide synthase